MSKETLLVGIDAKMSTLPLATPAWLQGLLCPASA
jgi:hypothetical protein